MKATCCDCGKSFERRQSEAWKVRCIACWAIAKGLAVTVAKSDPIRDELREHMRGLLSLCHPDRHGNSTLATTTTQWLLSLRDRLADRVPT